MLILFPSGTMTLLLMSLQIVAQVIYPDALIIFRPDVTFVTCQQFMPSQKFRTNPLWQLQNPSTDTYVAPLFYLEVIPQTTKSFIR